MRRPNVRVEARRLSSNASRQERERNTQQLLRIFKRACNEAGVMQEFKDHEFHQRPTDLRRRKKLNRIRTSQMAQDGTLKPTKEKDQKDRKDRNKEHRERD